MASEPSQRAIPARRPKSKAHLAKLEEIKRAAALQFSANGYAGTDVRSISDAVQLHVSTLYTYLSGKEELLYLVVRDGMLQASTAVDEAIDGVEDPIARFRAALTAHLKHHAVRHQVAWTARTEMRALTGAYRAEVIGLRDEYRDRWLQLVREGQQAGVISADQDPRLVVRVVLGLGHSISGWFRADGRLSPGELADAMTNLLLAGMLTR